MESGPDVVPERQVAEGLVEALAGEELEGRRVLVARAESGRDVLPDGLRERGAEVDVVALYRHRPLSPSQPTLEAASRADYVTFTSSSTVRNFVEAIGDAFPRDARVVSIGPVTSATARELGLEVHVEAAKHDVDGLVDALVEDATIVVTLLTDYGRDDEFVGVCHGVIRRIAPDVPIVDVTHGITRHGVRHGALVLAASLPYMPVGVHVAVVDPQVGTERRAVAVRCDDGRLLVGPDNGVLSLAWERAGGVGRGGRHQPLAAPARAGLGDLPRARPVRAGRGAPGGGRRAGGRRRPARRRRAGGARASVAPRRGRLGASPMRSCVDRFGNVSLDLRHEHLLAAGPDDRRRRCRSRRGGSWSAEATFVQTFADVAAGELLALRGRLGRARARGQPRRRRRRARRSAPTTSCASRPAS